MKVRVKSKDELIKILGTDKSQGRVLNFASQMLILSGEVIEVRPMLSYEYGAGYRQTNFFPVHNRRCYWWSEKWVDVIGEFHMKEVDV